MLEILISKLVLMQKPATQSSKSSRVSRLKFPNELSCCWRSLGQLQSSQLQKTDGPSRSQNTEQKQAEKTPVINILQKIPSRLAGVVRVGRGSVLKSKAGNEE
jgi:hypothetical protein